MKDLLDVIENFDVSQGSEIDSLIAISTDDDPEVRFRALEKLSQIDEVTPSMVSRVVSALQDEDELVVAEAIEIAGEWALVDCLEKLRDFIDSDSDIVQIAALTSLGKLRDSEYLNKIAQLYLTRNEDKYYLICLALYICGEAGYFEKLLSRFEVSEYQEKCRIINILTENISSDQAELALSSFSGFLENEKSTAVSSTLTEAIRDLTMTLGDTM